MSNANNNLQFLQFFYWAFQANKKAVSLSPAPRGELNLTALKIHLKIKCFILDNIGFILKRQEYLTG